MADETIQPKFGWDYTLPDIDFFDGVKYTTARNFLLCYSAEEISQIPFDQDLSPTQKLSFLLKYLDDSLADRERSSRARGKPYRETDYTAWKTVLLGLSTLCHDLGRYDIEEEIVRERYHYGLDGAKDMSALQELCYLLETTGRLAEAEQTGQECLRWMDQHPKLGTTSPQAIFVACVITRSIWGQHKEQEGRRWVAECRERISGMRESKFSKYSDKTAEQVEEMVQGLDGWTD